MPLLCHLVGDSVVQTNLSDEPNALGMPHLLTEMDHYKGYIFPKGSLIMANAWYVFTILASSTTSLRVLSGQCSATQGFTWIQTISTQSAS